MKHKFIPKSNDDGFEASYQGYELYKQGNYIEAEKALLYAVEKSVDAPAVYERLAILYRKQKRYTDEVAILQHGLAIMKKKRTRGAKIPVLERRLNKAKQIRYAKDPP